MQIEPLANRVIELLEGYLVGKIQARDLIAEYNALVSEKLDWNAGDAASSFIEEFQEELAFFVENPEWRKEHDYYYGDDILREKVNRFYAKLRSL